MKRLMFRVENHTDIVTIGITAAQQGQSAIIDIRADGILDQVVPEAAGEC